MAKGGVWLLLAAGEDVTTADFERGDSQPGALLLSGGVIHTADEDSRKSW
jgi:hypothetical protein